MYMLKGIVDFHLAGLHAVGGIEECAGIWLLKL